MFGSFSPSELTVQVGDTVRWVWVAGFHNVESGLHGVHDGNFRSGDPESGAVYELVFDQAFLEAHPIPGDVYPYYCAIHVHAGMTGTITVAGPSGPQIVHGTGLPGRTRPYSGFIDPHWESDDGVSFNQGLTQATLVFNEPVFGGGGKTAGAGDFEILETGNTAGPVVTSVTTRDDVVFEVEWDRPITPQQWVTVRAIVQNAGGVPIRNSGDLGAETDELDRIDIGSLPGDIDQNGAVQPADLMWFVSYVVVELPGGTCERCPHHVFGGEPEDYFDIDGNGRIEPLDLLRYRQLVSGTGAATQPWAGAVISPRP